MNRKQIILGSMVLAMALPMQMMAKKTVTDNSCRLWYNAPAKH